MRNPLRRQRTCRVAAAIAALVIAAACTNPADPTFNRGADAPQVQPGQRPLWDRRWAGRTREDQPVTFAVVGNEITDFSIAIDLAGDCHIGIFKAVVSDAPDAATANGVWCNSNRGSTWRTSRNR